VQIILNSLRLKPLEQVVPAAASAGAGIIVRVPLASGLLSGKYTAATTFGEDDHRNYNRQGAAFDIGETFAGVPFEVGLKAVERLRSVLPVEQTLAQFALRWILDQPGVSVVIPGARNPQQAKDNTVAASLPPLDAKAADTIRHVYDELIRPLVHDRW
jgi:aryl-alcohol dehydrogenase-like predicted oxidoreductase